MIIHVINQFISGLPGEVTGCCVAFSGGQDSTVLLHALSGCARARGGPPVRAVHVDHGLHPEAREWARHCQDFCATHGVELTSLTAPVARNGGRGLEAAAREARYAAMAAQLRPGESLLTAHHQEDQLETLLLRLMRGTGIEGLAGIAAQRPFATGTVRRPLLAVPKDAIEAYARAAELGWLDDPSNQDRRHDRNFLRHEVVPLLRGRWPGVAATVARTGRQAADAAAMLEDLAAADVAGLSVGGALNLAALGRLEPARQRNALRHLIRSRGFPPPSEAQLTGGLEQLLGARADRQPVMRWPGGQIRRYREHLYLLASDPASEPCGPPARLEWPAPYRPVTLGSWRGTLAVDRVCTGGLALPPVTLTIKYRTGGERIRGVGHDHHASLKHLFQQWGVLPWMRQHVPLVYSGDRIVAVADLMAAADFAAASGEPGFRIRWDGHAPYREAANSN